MLDQVVEKKKLIKASNESVDLFIRRSCLLSNKSLVPLQQIRKKEKKSTGRASKEKVRPRIEVTQSVSYKSANREGQFRESQTRPKIYLKANFKVITSVDFRRRHSPSVIDSSREWDAVDGVKWDYLPMFSDTFPPASILMGLSTYPTKTFQRFRARPAEWVS